MARDSLSSTEGGPMLAQYYYTSKEYARQCDLLQELESFDVWGQDQ